MGDEAVRAGMDDPHRIDAARRLLAQAPGEELDRLAVLSARLLGAAHAQVSLFTDRQVVLTPRAPRRPPADALAAQTFAGIPPTATVEGIRAYLGVPIEAAGARVGVLAVYDEQPFEWTQHDVDVLRELARAIAAELERGALAAELEASTVRLDLGFAAANIGSFDWDLATNALHWDERLVELFGCAPSHIDAFWEALHPDDRARVEAAVRSAVESCGDYAADYRIVHPDGSIRWVTARGRVLCDEPGRAARMLGAAFDATATHSIAERLGRALETMSTAFLTLDRSLRVTYVNSAAERIFGRRRHDLVGRTLHEVDPELDLSRTSFEYYHPRLDTWFDVRAMRSDDGLSVYFHDITDRVRAEQDAARLAGEREDALAASGAATGRLQILSAASVRLAGTLEIEELLRILADVVLNGFGTGVIIVLAERILDELGGSGFRVAHVAGKVEEAFVGAPVLASTLAAGTVRECPGRELAPALGDRNILTLPLVTRGRMIGAVGVVDPVGSALDRRVLIELAARASVALDNAVLFDAERRLALTLQRSLLPARLPALPGIELAARYLPGTGGRDVGGDFYLAHPLEDGRLLLVIGDVIGHGAQAAARMGQLRSVLAAYAYDGDPPDRVLAHLSIRLPALLDVPMATVLAAVYDPERRLLTFSLAGHPPPLLAPLDEDPAFVAATPGPPLGAGAAEYPRNVVETPAGATVVLYTDGLVEERGAPIDRGLERLRRALIAVKLPPDAVCTHVLKELDREQGAEDDIALLVMNHHPQARR